ncbi:MAG: hypothetical protein QOC64_2634 [Solirubrobacteraceae bacterium]|jgi:uncharacterized membrane protein YkoI|nr:hypothetical protein [Solirubrobacteraceae bacterium]
MLSSSRKTLTAIATVSAFAAGGAALAGAATSNKPADQPAQTALSGDMADKVKAAALAKVPGGTVLRVESGGPSDSKYHAHVRKSDGSEVTVLVNASFEATSVQTRPPGGRGGHGGPGGPGGPRQEALTGTTAAKVKAAALDKVPGGTVLRSEKGGPGNAAYHAHVRRSDGSEVVVLVNSSFEATSVETAPAGGRGGPGGRGHGPGGPGGGQETLTGDTAAKVKAAALDKVPGGTVLRVEKGGHGTTYHAHVRKSDGSEVVVLVNAQFEATKVEEFTRP